MQYSSNNYNWGKTNVKHNIISKDALQELCSIFQFSRQLSSYVTQDWSYSHDLKTNAKVCKNGRV